MLDWYFELPPWARFLVALVPLMISTFTYFGGTFWPWGWGAGAMLLIFAMPARGEKNKWGDY